MSDICVVSLCKKAAIVMTVAVILVLGLRQPFHNWDMIAYVAAAHNQDGLQGKDLSLTTYEDIKLEVGSTDFQHLIEGKYQASVFNDPNSLNQQLPFYNIKVVYIGLMRLLKQVGITYPIATYLISACFASASILLLAALCAHFSVSPLLIPFIALYSDYLPLAKFSTPDALAGFFALLSLYLFLKRSRLVYVLVVLMPLIRTDLVILSLLITGYIFVTQKNYYSLIAGFCSLLTYFSVNMIMGNYGYLVLFNFTFIGLDPYPRDMKLSIQPWEYVRPYVECAKEFIHHPHLLAYVVVSYLLFAKQSYKKVRSDLLSVIVISGSYIFLHVALFPHYEERFVAFPVSVMCVALFAIPLQNAALSPSALATPSRRLGIDRFFLRPKNAA